MGVKSRLSIILVVSFLFVPSVFADHLIADCPLTFVGSSEADSPFYRSPHGVFKNGSVIYVLRGQTLTTLAANDTGEVEVEREDFISTLAGRDVDGGTDYANGYLYVSSEAGLEIFDLRNVHGGVGGTAPTRVSRTITPHYREIAVFGNVLAAMFPIEDMPCVPQVNSTCRNKIDIYSITNLSAPVKVAEILSSTSTYLAFADIEWANGYLYATGPGGTFAFDLSNPALPTRVRSYTFTGDFLITNGSNLLAIGQRSQVGVFLVGPGPDLSYFSVYTLPSIFLRGNELMFHQGGFLDSTRLVMMVDEEDPATGESARTIAFDVFDFTVPYQNGFDDRPMENVSFVFPNERKHDPILVGPFLYVLGEISGSQVWGACGQIAGGLDLDRVTTLSCNGAEIHGWVTGQKKVTQVEVFLDGSSLGFATLGDVRNDVSSRTPPVSWRLAVNLDNTSEGNHVIRVLGTDVDGNRRQFASDVFYFPGPGENCTNRRRTTKRPGGR